jgi:hypothetical protein
MGARSPAQGAFGRGMRQVGPERGATRHSCKRSWVRAIGQTAPAFYSKPLPNRPAFGPPRGQRHGNSFSGKFFAAGNFSVGKLPAVLSEQGVHYCGYSGPGVAQGAKHGVHRLCEAPVENEVHDLRRLAVGAGRLAATRVDQQLGVRPDDFQRGGAASSGDAGAVAGRSGTAEQAYCDAHYLSHAEGGSGGRLCLASPRQP